MELRPEVEIAGRVLPIIDLDATIIGGEGVEEGQEAVFLEVGNLSLDLLVPAVKASK